ncbi:MAG: NAD(P)/FAD-dependent oxidoreductase, partial [Gammaproteobacteria bacterium]
MANRDIIEISGAGPAGLAAALFVQHAGGQARIFERRKDVGSRFHGDFQGLENWTTDIDVLLEMQSLGIQTDFDYQAFHDVVCLDSKGKPHRFHSRLPLFYLVKRGADPGSLDMALKQQALQAGVEICFGETVSNMPAGGITTHGPQRADVIAAGYLFETDMADGAWAVVSDDLAPKGYAYLLVHNGRGTLASCMYADFHKERDYVSRCVDFFQRHIQLRMKHQKRFGGAGNAVLHEITHKGNILYAGEAAGFQDALFGFGMRWAMLSGTQAARALL